MNCDRCGKEINKDNTGKYKDYYIECRQCFDKTQVFVHKEETKDITWIGHKKFNPGSKPE